MKALDRRLDHLEQAQRLRAADRRTKAARDTAYAAWQAEVLAMTAADREALRREMLASAEAQGAISRESHVAVINLTFQFLCR